MRYAYDLLISAKAFPEPMSYGQLFPQQHVALKFEAKYRYKTSISKRVYLEISYAKMSTIFQAPVCSLVTPYGDIDLGQNWLR